jgi:hypothetical protein
LFVTGCQSMPDTSMSCCGGLQSSRRRGVARRGVARAHARGSRSAAGCTHLGQRPRARPLGRVGVLAARVNPHFAAVGAKRQHCEAARRARAGGLRAKRREARPERGEERAQRRVRARAATTNKARTRTVSVPCVRRHRAGEVRDNGHGASFTGWRARMRYARATVEPASSFCAAACGLKGPPPFPCAPLVRSSVLVFPGGLSPGFWLYSSCSPLKALAFLVFLLSRSYRD